MRHLEEDPDDRHIFWAHDAEGGKGKSYLASLL